MSNIETITREHDNFSSSYDELVSLLERVITNRKITQDDKYDLEKAHATYSENYNEVKRILENERQTNLKEQIKAVSDSKLDADIKSIVNILTNNGEKTTLYLDEDGVLYIDGEKIPEIRQTKLIVDEQNGKIESLVADGFVEDAEGNKVKLKVLYSTLSQTVNGIETNVGTIEGVANDANSKAEAAITKASQLKQTVDGIKSTVTSTSTVVDGSIKETYNEFYLSDSNTSATGGAWSTTAPAPQSGKYIWLRDVYVTNKGDKTYGNPVCITGAKGDKGERGLQGLQGEKGEQGVPGKDGDGRTSYFHIKYSSVSNPTSSDQMSETPNIYIGTYVDFDPSDSTDPNKYTWYRFQGLQGEKGERGIPGVGTDGKTSYLHIKYSNDGGQTFTSYNGETVGTYIGTYTDFNPSDSHDVGSYTWAKIKGDQGSEGIGVKQVQILYYVHYSKTSAPSTSSTGWTTYIPAYQTDKYLWQVNKITYTDNSIAFTTPVYLSSWEANNKAETAISIANQTSEKFEWIVQKGSTSSSITLTDSLIQAIASSNIQLSAKKILINGLMEGSGWKITDEGELDILDLNVRGNFTCDSLSVDTLISADIPPALSENKTIYVSSGETISQYLDDLPLNLNGFTVEIYLTSNTTENLELRRHVNGLVNIFLCSNTIKGTIRSIYNNAKYSIYGGNSTTDTTMGSIMPYTSYNVGSYYYTTIFSDCPNVNLYNLKVYGDSVNSNSVGVGATQKSKVYMENISFVGCKYNCRTYSMTELYCQSSSGLSTGNSWNAGTGAKIVLYPGQQAGGGNNTFTSGNGQIISTGVTFASSKDSGSNTTTVNPTTTRFETFKPKYADTYRSSVYNNWEGRGKCRQGDWGYGDCNGYWFYGSQFAEVKGKNITKIEIDVTRSSDIGYSASTSHVFQAHTYSGRPSSTPSFYASCNKTLSLAWGKKGTVTITDSTVLNGIKSGTIKGFGIQSTYDKSHYSALSNGTVRIYYTE
nr:MAG TPA: tail protein [Caudoviricetes sp.]